MRKIHLKDWLLIVLILLGYFLQAQTLNKKAIEKRIEKVSTVPKKQFHDTIIALCNELRFYDREFASVNVKKLADLSETINPKSQVFALIYYAKLSDKGQIDIIDEAYSLAIKHQIDEYIGWALVTKSELYKLMGDNDLAMANILKARDFYEKTNNTIELVDVIHVIGDLHFAAQSYQEAEDIYNEILEVKGDLNDWYSWREKVVQNNLGLIAKRRGLYDKAINHFNYTLKLKGEDFETRDDTIRQSYIYSQLAEIYRLKNNPTKSLSYYDKGIAPALKYKQYAFASELYFTKSHILLSQMKLNEALQFAHLSETISKESYSSLQFQINITRLLSEIHEKKGNEKIALKYIKKADLLSDSLNENVYQSRFLQLLAQKDNELINFKLEKKEKENSYLIIFILIMLGGLFYFYSLNLQVKKAYIKLVQKNIEIENSTYTFDKPTNLKKDNSISTSSEIDPSLKLLIHQLEKSIQNEKWFLQHDFNLQKAAELLDTNRTYLSKAVNTILGINFNTYINNLRIKESIQLIKTGLNETLTIESISNQVGFNSRSVFINAFRSYTGVTPSFFIKNHTENENS